LRSASIDLQPHLDSGLLRCHSTRPTLQGLEPHLASMLKDVASFSSDIVVVDPLSALLSNDAHHQTLGMLLRLIDYLKSRSVTALLTTLQSEDNQTDLSLSSIMDTWVLVRYDNVDDSAVRRLQIVKSRGMAHSSERRVMEITSQGVKLQAARASQPQE
jgi:circadian clock protein KaiC